MTTDTPTPRAVLIQKAWMRQHDALQAFIGHPGVPWEPVKQAQQDIEAAIRADERAALAASAGPLGTDAIGSAQRHLETTLEVDDAHRVWLDTRKHLVAVLTAYTALAAERAALREELERCVVEAGGDATTYRSAAETVRSSMCQRDELAHDLAALRATVAEFNDFYPELAQLVNGFIGSDPESWSDWDRSVQQRLIVMAAKLRDDKNFLASFLARTPTPEGQG